MMGRYLPYFLSVFAGVALWAGTMMVAHRREPWDADLYWTLSYPLAMLAAAVLGYLFPLKAWRWAVLVMAMQLMVMIADGSDLGLLPLGVIFLGVLTVPPALAGVLAAKLRTYSAG